MKKIIFLLGIFLIISKLNTIWAQELEWDYPIKLGSPEWRKLEYPEGMLKACQIDEKKLKTISTKGLVKIIMKYPYFTGYTVYNSPYLGFIGGVSSFNGYQELSNRKNGYKAIFETFIDEDFDKLATMKDSVERGKQTLVWIGLEMMLSNDTEILKLTKEEKNDMLKKLSVKHEQKMKYTDDFGGIGNMATALLSRKLLKELIKENKSISLEKEKKLKTFDEKMTIDDPALLVEMVLEFKDYIKNLK